MPTFNVTPEARQWLVKTLKDYQNIQGFPTEGNVRQKSLQSFQDIWQRGVAAYGLPGNLTPDAALAPAPFPGGGQAIPIGRGISDQEYAALKQQAAIGFPGQVPAIGAMPAPIPADTLMNPLPIGNYAPVGPGPGLQGATGGGVFSQVLNMQPQNQIDLENKRMMLQALNDQQRNITEHVVGTGQLGLSAAQLDVQRQATTGSAATSVAGQTQGPQATPEQLGFRPPPAGAMVSQAFQTFTNPMTGQNVTVPTGGYAPPPGWVRGGAGTPIQPAGAPIQAPPPAGGGFVAGVGGGNAPAVLPTSPMAQTPQINLAGALPPTLAAQRSTLTGLGITPQATATPPTPATVPTPTGTAPQAVPQRYVYQTSSGYYYPLSPNGQLSPVGAPVRVLPQGASLAASGENFYGGTTYAPDLSAQQTAYEQYQNNLRVPLATVTPTVPQTWRFSDIPTITPQMVSPQVLQRFSPSEQSALGNLIQEQNRYTVPDWMQAHQNAFAGLSTGQQGIASPYFLGARY